MYIVTFILLYILYNDNINIKNNRYTTFNLDKRCIFRATLKAFSRKRIRKYQLGIINMAVTINQPKMFILKADIGFKQ